MKKKLILTVGLPRSGKSTWAKQQGLPIVNRDAIRLALHGQAFLAEAEDMVTVIENYMVKSLFLAGHDTIIIDATHLKLKYRQRWIDFVNKHIDILDWDDLVLIEYKVFGTSMEECIERAEKDSRKDLIPVIERMYFELDKSTINLLDMAEDS